jgi:hypothetical protein
MPVIHGERIRTCKLTDKLTADPDGSAGNKELALPECRVSWGEGRSPTMDFPFVGVVRLTQEFTLFDSNGTPRANVDVKFEFLSA